MKLWQIQARLTGITPYQDFIVKPPRQLTDAEIKAKQVEYARSGRSLMLETLAENPLSQHMQLSPVQALFQLGLEFNLMSQAPKYRVVP